MSRTRSWAHRSITPAGSITACSSTGCSFAVFSIAVTTGTAVTFGGIAVCNRLLLWDTPQMIWGLIASVLAGTAVGAVVSLVGTLALDGHHRRRRAAAAGTDGNDPKRKRP